VTGSGGAGAAGPLVPGGHAGHAEGRPGRRTPTRQRPEQSKEGTVRARAPTRTGQAARDLRAFRRGGQAWAAVQSRRPDGRGAGDWFPDRGRAGQARVTFSGSAGARRERGALWQGTAMILVRERGPPLSGGALDDEGRLLGRHAERKGPPSPIPHRIDPARCPRGRNATTAAVAAGGRMTR